MKEDFLHYVWKFQKFATRHLETVSGQQIAVQNPGHHNLNSGPDFLHAQVRIDGQLWAGNVEIHLKSSDWYAHQHQNDPAFDSVLLHIVWEHDVEVVRKNDSVIPVLQLKTFVRPNAVRKYQQLLYKKDAWINCEANFATVSDFVLENWLERLYLERLQQKSEQILLKVAGTKNHWEAVLFQILCKNFGLKVNGASFTSVANAIPFSVVQKCRNSLHSMEALLLGQAGLLDGAATDTYVQGLREAHRYLVHKHNLTGGAAIAPRFFRLRPANFPTIRLAQIAALYATNDHLFSKIIAANTKEELYGLFDVKASGYWDTHYNFGVVSARSSKRLTRKFIDLLAINTLIPIKFCYASQQNSDVLEQLLALARTISAEKNTIITHFNTLRPTATNAMESQGLLQLKNNYCDANYCLRCAVGNSILNTEG